MYYFLLPLLVGFTCNAASAFTTTFSRRWGERRGRALTFILRNILGIPVWVISLALAVRASSPLLFTPTPFTDVLGWLLVVAGLLLICAARLTLGWRAAAPSTGDELEARGPYRHIRHPVYSGLLLEFAGILLLKPSQAVLLASTLCIIWVLLQARLEERDLLQRMPAYREYMSQVPRFLPRRK